MYRFLSSLNPWADRDTHPDPQEQSLDLIPPLDSDQILLNACFALAAAELPAFKTSLQLAPQIVHTKINIRYFRQECNEFSRTNTGSHKDSCPIHKKVTQARRLFTMGAYFCGDWGYLIHMVGCHLLNDNSNSEPEFVSTQDQEFMIQCYQALISAGGDVNIKNHLGGCALSIRINDKTQTCVTEFLLQAGAARDIMTCRECTVELCIDPATNTRMIHSIIDDICRSGYYEHAQLLLKYGLDVSPSSFPNVIRSVLANEHHPVQLLRLFLQCGASPNKWNFKDPSNFRGPGELIIQNKLPICLLDALYEFGMIIDELEDASDGTLLSDAIAVNNFAAAVWLLDHGANVEGQANGILSDVNPLLQCARGKCYDIANLLIERGAKLNGVVCERGKIMSILDLALIDKSSEDLEVLLKLGSDPNSPCSEMSRLLYKMFICDLKSVQMLVQSGYNISKERSSIERMMRAMSDGLVPQNSSSNESRAIIAYLNQKFAILDSGGLIERTMPLSREEGRAFFTRMYGSA